MPAPKGKRPISRAIQLVNELRESLKFWTRGDDGERFNELHEILVRIDASTGRPDSSRKRRPAKRAKKATK